MNSSVSVWIYLAKTLCRAATFKKKPLHSYYLFAIHASDETASSLLWVVLVVLTGAVGG